MPQTEQWTVGRLLQVTTDYLRRHGSESPRLDAEILLAHARHCERIQLYTAYAEVTPEAVRAVFRELVRRRAEGTPVAYLVGRCEFYMLSFRVTPDVLIPRPETELLVEVLLDLIKNDDSCPKPLEIADVGTGSGNIAVCVARHVPDCRVTAIDSSRAALDVARGNVADLGVSQQVELVEGDLLEDLPADRRFDFVVSNLPYVSRAELEQLAPEVKDHEPRVALLAGQSGSRIIGRLIPQAARRLRPAGWFLAEISPMIEPQIHDLIRANGHFEQLSSIEDLARHPRVVQARRLSGCTRPIAEVPAIDARSGGDVAPGEVSGVPAEQPRKSALTAMRDALINGIAKPQIDDGDQDE